MDEDHAHVRGARVVDADTEMTGTLAVETVDEKQRRTRPPSFLDALAILCHPDYKLVDAYPTLCQVYSIAVAVPVSSTTAERSFSELKRIKTRIRSSMIQERLESLLAMTIEKKILLSLDVEKIIELFAKTSNELSKALL